MLTERERANWQAFMSSIGAPLARALLNDRGYFTVAEIQPELRESVMAGMADDVRSRFRHNKNRDALLRKSPKTD